MRPGFSLLCARAPSTPELAIIFSSMLQIELYAAAQPEWRLMVHTLTYTDSQEQRTFLAQVEREVKGL